MDRLVEFEKIPVGEARRCLAALIRRAHEGQERIVLTQRGKPVAVLVPPDDVELLVDLEDMADAEMAREARERIKVEGTISWEDLKAEIGLTGGLLPTPAPSRSRR